MNVNGENTEFFVKRTGKDPDDKTGTNDKKTVSFFVPEGDVTITGSVLMVKAMLLSVTIPSLGLPPTLFQLM